MTEEEDKVWRETAEGLTKVPIKDALDLMAAHLATLIYDFKDRRKVPNIEQATQFTLHKFNENVINMVDTLTINRAKETPGHA